MHTEAAVVAGAGEADEEAELRGRPSEGETLGGVGTGVGRGKGKYCGEGAAQSAQRVLAGIFWRARS